MDERNLNIWELLGRKLTGEASSAELLQLDYLLNEEGKAEEMQDLEARLGAYWKEVKVDEEAAEVREHTIEYKNKVMEKIAPDAARDNRQKTETLYRRETLYRNKKLWKKIAVVVVFLVGGWFVYQALTANQANLNTVVTKAGSKTMITLPDGTEVWLNADSKLQYPNDFQHVATREVTLTGEAYFKVKHDASHPFIIHTRGLTIKDIGTEFNLKAYPDDKEASVSLITGSVAVSLSNEEKKDLILKPGEKVVYYGPSKEISSPHPEQKEKEKCAEKTLQKIDHPLKLKVTKIHPLQTKQGASLISETAWKDDKLVFKRTQFEDLARQLSRWYGVDISIDSRDVAHYTFTGIFEKETLSQALQELQMVRPFKYTIQNNQVTIYN